MSKLFVDQVDPKTATTLTLGTSGDTIDIPSGVTLDTSSSTLTLPSSAITGQTAITSLADTDKFLVSDASDSGNLKYVEKQYLPSGTHVLVASSVEASTDVSAITLDGHVNHSLYSFYKFYARLEYSTNAITLNFRFRDSGSSITASNYNHTAFGKTNTAGSLADETQVNWGGGETNLATNVSYGYPSFISGELYHDVSGGIGNYSMMKGLHAIPRWNGSAHQHRIMNFHVTYDNGSQSTDGFTLYPSSGTFDRHEIYVYGVAK